MAEYNKTKSHQIRKSDIQEIRGSSFTTNTGPKQNCIVVPPPQNIMEVKKKKNYRGQRPLIKYKIKQINKL